MKISLVDTWSSFQKSLLYSWKLLLTVFGVVLLILSISTLVSEHAGVPISSLLNDPVHFAKMPFYVGMLSNLGGMLWSAAAASCFMGAALARKDRRKSFFLLASGIFTAWLGLDDMWLFHESIIPDYLHIGEGYIYLAYGILGVAYVLYFFKDILSTRGFPILGVALAFFALSIGIDKLISLSDMETLAEDGLKLFAIAFWLLYFSTTSFQIAKETA